MTTEQRLERIERIAKLFVRAGLRERRNRQYLDEKINIIVMSRTFRMIRATVRKRFRPLHNKRACASGAQSSPI